MDELRLSIAIEDLLVNRNPRGMKTVQASLEPGYYLRAARLLRDVTGTVLIGTGFPVADTFETDGPAGAMVLYTALERMGARPVLVCDSPLCDVLAEDHRVHRIRANGGGAARSEAREALVELAPEVIVSIERPGLTAAGSYVNVRGEDITDRCARFDDFVESAACPTVAIGDGGNEIGMGNAGAALSDLGIAPAATRCDELLIADVSNWGVYGLLAIIGYWRGEDLLGAVSPPELLSYLCGKGGVDGITRENAPTEDGLPAAAGMEIIRSLRSLTGPDFSPVRSEMWI